EVRLYAEGVFDVQVRFLEAVLRVRQPVPLGVSGGDAGEEHFPGSEAGAVRDVGDGVVGTEGPVPALRSAGHVVECRDALIDARTESMAADHQGVVVHELVVALAAD